MGLRKGGEIGGHKADSRCCAAETDNIVRAVILQVKIFLTIQNTKQVSGVQMEGEIKGRLCWHSASNPWLLSVRSALQRPHGGPSAGMVRWGSWCCESGRRQSENGYFTTPGSHPTPGSAPSSSPHPASTSASAGAPPSPPGPQQAAFRLTPHAVQMPLQTQEP